MMRFRSLSKLRSYLLPAVAAIVLAIGPVACSSTGEEEPSATLEGAASGEEAASGNVANGNAAASGENANANANTEAANTAKPEGEASSSNNPIGNELNNAIGGEGGANASAEAANAEANANAEAANANANAAAEPSNGEANALAGDAAANANAPVAGPADANVSNPFSGGAAAPMPSENAAPSANAAYSASNTPPAAEAPQASAPAETATPATAASSQSEGSVSGPSSLPEMGSKMAYYVMRGDTLGAIAQKIYGSRGKWKALQTENGLVDANKIYPGDVIYFTLNDASKAFAEKYEMSTRQLYTVSKGDTLARLAAKFYGTQGAWRALWKENPQILNPDRIRVGLVLTYRTAEKVALKDEEETDVENLQDSSAEANADEPEAVTPSEVLTAAAE